jgi:putative SOS response-associated peptidase YedK
VESAPVHLLLPFPGNTLEMHAANPKVGNVRNQGTDLLEP